MNDFYGSIVHQDRMADLRLEADATRRVRRDAGTAPRRRPVVPRRLAAGIAGAVLACLFVLANSGLVN